MNIWFILFVSNYNGNQKSRVNGWCLGWKKAMKTHIDAKSNTLETKLRISQRRRRSNNMYI